MQAESGLPASDRAHRIGSLFVHPGGSGGAGVSWIRTAPPGALAPVARRFDVVGVDTLGVGASRPAIACGACPEPPGPYSPPFARPEPEPQPEEKRREPGLAFEAFWEGLVKAAPPGAHPTDFTRNPTAYLHLLEDKAETEADDEGDLT